jgi:flavin-binding protein dodecin
MPDITEMEDHVYKILELVGSSEKSIEDAVQNAITRASKTVRYMKWLKLCKREAKSKMDLFAITRSPCGLDLP